MKRYLNTFFLSLCVFVAFVIFYITSATTAIPGTSAQFLTSVLHPGVFEYLPQYPLDAVLYHHTTHIFPCENILLGVRIVAALIGSLIVLLILRSLQTVITMAVCDTIENTDEEREQVCVDRTLVKRLSTCVFAPLAMVGFPLWVMATRPMDGHATVLLVTLLFWLSLVLRGSYTVALERNEQLSIKENSLITIIFFLLTFILMLSPTLLIILLLPLGLTGRVFFLVYFEHRSTQLMWAAMGLVMGAFFALMFYALAWIPLFYPTNEAHWGLLWATYFQSSLKSLPTVIHSFETIASWVFYLLNVALFLGTFPRAFYKVFTPLFGQFCILASWGFVFLGWPSSFWMSMIEPDPIATSGMILLILNTSLVVASWARNWLDANAFCPIRKKYIKAFLMCAIPALFFFIASIYFFTNDASCHLANTALNNAWANVHLRLTDKEQLWLNPTEGCESLLLERCLAKRPLTPLTNPTQHLQQINLDGKPWEVVANEDVLLKELATIGDAPLTIYLEHSQWGNEVFIGDPYYNHHENMIAIAKFLTTTPFAKTTLGQRTVRDCYRTAAIQLANAAVDMPPIEALNALRTAYQYDPTNKGIILSIASFANEGYMVSNEETNRATTVYNELPHLEKPSFLERAKFEKQYGLVRTPAFDTARRLAHFNAGITTNACLQNLIKLYTETPQVLSLDERLYAMLHMDEPEAFKVLLREIRASDASSLAIEEEMYFRELECFLLRYIHTPNALTLYKENQQRFNNLRTSYVPKLYEVSADSLSFSILSEKIVSFYHRDQHLAYALYYVNYLLAKDRLNEATDFLTSFDVHESLIKRPLFNQYLSRLLVEAWTPKNPEMAQKLLASWLFSNPEQPVLWTLYLQRITDTELLKKSIRECLRYYPMHPLATRLFADECRIRYGEDVAQRYLNSIQQAQQHDARNAPHAHR